MLILSFVRFMRLPLAAARIDDYVSVLPVQRVIAWRAPDLPGRFQQSKVVLYSPFAYAELFCHDRHGKPPSAPPADEPQKPSLSFISFTHKSPPCKSPLTYKGIRGVGKKLSCFGCFSKSFTKLSQTKNQPDNGLTFQSLFSFEKSPLII